MLILGLAILFATSIAAVLYVFLDTYGGEGSLDNKIKNRLEGLLSNEPAANISRNTTFSNIEKLNKVLIRQRFSQKLHYLMVLSGWNMPLSIFMLLDLLWGFTVYVLVKLVSGSELLGLFTGAALAALPYIVLVINKRRYVEKFTQAFPDALMMMKGAIKAGQGIQATFQIVSEEGPSPVNMEFARICQEVQLGASIYDSLNELYRRVQTVDIRLFILGVHIQHEVGGNLLELFDRVETTIRDRITLSREVKALSAQGKMTGGVLILLPLGLMVIISVISPGYFAPLLQDELGKKILGAAFVLQILGSVIIHKITSFKTA